MQKGETLKNYSELTEEEKDFLIDEYREELENYFIEWDFVSESCIDDLTELQSKLGIHDLEINQESYGYRSNYSVFISPIDMREVVEALMLLPKYTENDLEFAETLKKAEGVLSYIEELTFDLSEVELDSMSGSIEAYIHTDYTISEALDEEELHDRIEQLVTNEYSREIAQKAKKIQMQMKFIAIEDYFKAGVEEATDELLERLVDSLVELKEFEEITEYINKKIDEFVDEWESIYDELNTKEYLLECLKNEVEIRYEEGGYPIF